MKLPFLLGLGVCAFSCAQVSLDDNLAENHQAGGPMGGEAGLTTESGYMPGSGGSANPPGNNDPTFTPTVPEDMGDGDTGSGGSTVTMPPAGSAGSGNTDAMDCGITVGWTPSSPCNMTAGTLVTYNGEVFEAQNNHSYCQAACPPEGAEDWCATQQAYKPKPECSP